MAVLWPDGVNQDAYGMDMNSGENVERIDFESGKSRTYLKNTKPKKIFSFMLSLEDVGDTSEYKTFISWWDTTLLSGSLSFLFPSLITHTGSVEYRPTDSFSATGQRIKEITLTVEEM